MAVSDAIDWIVAPSKVCGGACPPFHSSARHKMQRSVKACLARYDMCHTHLAPYAGKCNDYNFTVLQLYKAQKRQFSGTSVQLYEAQEAI